MARLFRAGCVLALLCWSTAQNTEDLDSLIAQVYGVNTGTNNPPPAGQGGDINVTSSETGGAGTVAGTGDCTCVPYYLCKNNTIIKDGRSLIEIRMNDAPCKNYFEVCCGTGDVVENPIPKKPQPDRPKGCGWRNPEGVGFRITEVSDDKAQFAEFPWMVAVLRVEPIEGSTNKSNVYHCGGSLIHPKAVLTAAHCVTGKNLGKKYKIRAGEWDSQTTSEILPHQDRDVETIITHEHFRSGILYNDVALLILKHPVEITENINVVCLPPSNQVIDSSKCFATGWGKNMSGKEGNYQALLKKVELPMVAHSKCQDLLRNKRLGVHFKLHRTFVCAGGEPGKDTCQGDGGSPLVCPVPGIEGRYQQAGIVAWGIRCGEQGVPGVYANIAALRDWIDEQMAYQKLDVATYRY